MNVQPKKARRLADVATGVRLSRAARAPLFAILLLALGLRLLLWAQPLHQPANDEVEYLTVAYDLLAGRGWQFYTSYDWLRAPLYPLFLAGSLWLAGQVTPGASEALQLAALPNILLSTVNVYLAYRLARALVGQRAATLAALLTAILWTNVTFASLYMAETLFTCLFSLGLLGVLQIVDCRLQIAAILLVFLAGVAFGLAALTRSAVLPLLPVVALWLLVRPTTSEDGRRKTEDGRSRAEEEEQYAPASRSPSTLDPRPSTLHPRPSTLHPPPSTLQRLLTTLAFTLAVILTIAPWTLRNYQAYGQPVLIETGLSYNLWLFNEPRESRQQIAATLRAMPNPAQRAEYATARGLARLREDPAILLRKLWPNWVYLTRVKPIQDRFLQEDYRADVGLPLFATALLLDDALYLLIALAGSAGLLLQQRAKRAIRGSACLAGSDASAICKLQSSNLQSAIGAGRASAARWLCIAWLLIFILTALLTHGEARYRHFLFPVLIPYAAAVLVDLRRWPGALRTTLARGPGGVVRTMLVGGLLALLSFTVLSNYPTGWASQNLARGWYTLVGEGFQLVGRLPGALLRYERAAAAQPSPDSAIRLGDAYRALGDVQRATASYQEAIRRTASYPPAHGRLGDLLRARGEAAAARAAFAGADPQALTVWAWRELPPTAGQRLDIGAGLDIGLVSGVYPAEVQQGATARWSDGLARLRLRRAASSPDATVLRLRLAAPHPAGQPVPVDVCINGACQRLMATPTWRSYTLMVPRAPRSNLVVELRSPTFEDANRRQLGVLIDRAETVP